MVDGNGTRSEAKEYDLKQSCWRQGQWIQDGIADSSPIYKSDTIWMRLWVIMMAKCENGRADQDSPMTEILGSFSNLEDTNRIRLLLLQENGVR